MENFVKAWKESTLSQKEFSEFFNISVRTCQRKLNRARFLGLLEKQDSLVFLPKDIENEIKDRYLSGEGLFLVAKNTGIHPSSVKNTLIRLKIPLRTKNQFKPTGKPRRKRRLSIQEFTDATKRLRFEQEVGICQECKRSIGLHWRQATYHHIVNCKDGGTADAANCMVLHFECHNDPETFKRLHGFDILHLENY